MFSSCGHASSGAYNGNDIISVEYVILHNETIYFVLFNFAPKLGGSHCGRLTIDTTWVHQSECARMATYV